MSDSVNQGKPRQLLNQKRLAVVLDVSAPYLSRLTKEGRIAFADPEQKLYDLDAVRAQLERSRDVRQVVATETRRQARDAGAAVAAPPPAGDGSAGLDEDEPEYGSDHHANYKIAASFEKREAARIARIERMERMELEKSVCRVADMEREAYTEARIIRDTLLGALPTKLAPMLAPIADPFALEQALREGLRAALHDIVRQIEGVDAAG